MKLLELKDVVKDYKGFKALDKVSFSIEEGSIYGFVGENGAGKTTTMNIICGLSKETSGKILFMGKDIKDNRNIGYLPQEPKFYEFLTVREYMDFIISSCGIKDKDYGDKLLKMVGLEEAKSKYIESLSGGMKQRLGIAAAICNNPRLLILDEPTSALDPEGRREVLDIIRRLRDEGMTIFFSTHLLSDVENLCDYVTILHKGRVITSSSMEDLKKDNQSIYYEVSYKGEIKISSMPDYIKEIEHRENKILIKLKEKLSYENELYKYILSLGVDVISCTKKELSLEDIFFNIIKGGKGYDA